MSAFVLLVVFFMRSGDVQAVSVPVPDGMSCAQAVSAIIAKALVMHSQDEDPPVSVGFADCQTVKGMALVKA